jgi:hypothetical protein
VKARKMRLAGHVACMTEMRNSNNILVLKQPGRTECVYSLPSENSFYTLASYIGYMFRHIINAIFRRFIRNYEEEDVYLKIGILYCVNRGGHIFTRNV